jgi:tetratricopeptide (TPR) repeat protein
LGDTAGEASTLSGIGNTYQATGQAQKALEWYQQVLSLRGQAGDKAGEAGALANIALVYRDTGQPQKALEFFEQALPAFRQAGDKANEAYTLYGIAGVQAQRGRFRTRSAIYKTPWHFWRVSVQPGGLSEAKVASYLQTGHVPPLHPGAAPTGQARRGVRRRSEDQSRALLDLMAKRAEWTSASK